MHFEIKLSSCFAGLSSSRLQFLSIGNLRVENQESGLKLMLENLKAPEVEKVFTALQCSKRVTGITIISSDISDIDEDLLANVLSRMISVRLSKTSLTSSQMTKFFCKLRMTFEMEELNISGNLMSKIPAKELAMSLVKIKSITLEYTYLTEDQTTHLLKAAMEETSRLEHIKLGTFGYGWMDGRDVSHKLPTNLKQLLSDVKKSGKVKVELDKFDYIKFNII